MNGVKAFVDTNLFVYLYSDTEPAKRRDVGQALNKFQRYVSTQVLNEFCNVCIRKLKLPLSVVREAIDEIRDVCHLIVVDDATVTMAINLCERYGYAYYDCLIIASAIECGCKYILSEDLSSGQMIQGVMIKNVFE